MEKKQVSRKSFLKSLFKKSSYYHKEENNTHDPLFEKYSRKSLTNRYFSKEEKVQKPEEIIHQTGNISSGLEPYTGIWSEWEVKHLLSRTNYGYKKSFIDQLLLMSVSSAVDNILNVDTSPPPPPVNAYQNWWADENGLPYGADWTNDPFVTGMFGEASNRFRMDCLRRWLFGLTLNNDNTIREKMVWFWYHFIPVDFEAVIQAPNSFCPTNCARILFQYMKLFRDNAVGNFKTLIRSVATEPAMMYYLNNQVNSATAPDENFARELMELFTLGKDTASQYTESDVVAAAKVLTGWRVENLTTVNPVTNFLPQFHNNENKQFSSFFNNTVINYKPGNAGAIELDELINMIFSKNTVVAKYICGRLYRYYVYYEIDDNIEANIITPLAQTFINNSWNIIPVLNQLFKSQHFFDMANRGVYIKSPFDLVAGTLNIFNVETIGHSIENQYQIWNYYNDNICMSMEQQMGRIPNVSGWTAYYQTPAYHQFWINSNTIQKRFKFIKDLFNGYQVDGHPIKTDTILFVQRFGNTVVADPDLLVVACIKHLLPIDLSQIQIDDLKKSCLLGGQINNQYWTNAWNDYQSNPNNTTKKGIVETRLKTLLSDLCQLAEYQLM
jgi:uncharacterized protein (DUF1800 family)